MTSPPAILEGGGLRLGFQQCGDRLAHTIGAVAGDRLVPLLASVEGNADELWPESPALQTIDTQSARQHPLPSEPAMPSPRPSPIGRGRSVAMLVGMAGRTHWSLSVELDPAAGRLTFEVAARLKELPARLGSAYRTMVAPRLEPSGALVLSIDSVAVRIEPTGPLENQPDGVRTRLRPTDEGLSLSLEIPELELPCTVRWGYTMSRIT